MSKDNILFMIIGLLAGLIIGFVFTNSINQSAVKPAAAVSAPLGAVPPGHPEIGESGGAMQTQVQAAIDRAKAEPDNYEAQIKAAEMYYQIQRFEGAIEFLKQANKLKPDHYETIVNLGNAYFDSNRYEESEKFYAAALAKKPGDANVRTDLGLTFIFRQPPNYDRAVEEFLRSLETNPNHVQALQNLTVAYSKKGDAAKAKVALSRLEALDSANPAIAALRDDIQKLETK